jgi:hypothetical protein
MSDCLVEDCLKPVKAKGLCGMHYARANRKPCPVCGSPMSYGRNVCRACYLAACAEDRPTSKSCPQCGTEQRYSSPADLKKALAANKLCRSCATKKTLETLEYTPPSVDLQLPTQVCLACEMEFNPLDYKPNQKYCSKYCRQTHSGKLSAEKRGDIQRGRGAAKGYRKLMGRHEHRVVAEEILGRPLAADEVIHHINHNKQDNRPENLHVMVKSEHAKLHADQYWKERREKNA